MDPLELRFSQRKMRNVTGQDINLYQPLAYLATLVLTCILGPQYQYRVGGSTKTC